MTASSRFDPCLASPVHPGRPLPQQNCPLKRSTQSTLEKSEAAESALWHYAGRRTITPGPTGGERWRLQTQSWSIQEKDADTCWSVNTICLQFQKIDDTGKGLHMLYIFPKAVLLPRAVQYEERVWIDDTGKGWYIFPKEVLLSRAVQYGEWVKMGKKGRKEDSLFLRVLPECSTVTSNQNCHDKSPKLAWWKKNSKNVTIEAEPRLKFEVFTLVAWLGKWVSECVCVCVCDKLSLFYELLLLVLLVKAESNYYSCLPPWNCSPTKLSIPSAVLTFLEVYMFWIYRISVIATMFFCPARLLDKKTLRL